MRYDKRPRQKGGCPNMKLKSDDYGNPLWFDKRRRFGLPLSFTRYILSPNRFYVNRGFLSIREDRLELYRVTDIALLLPWTDRMFGCGTIEIHSMDRTNPILLIKSVKEPRKVLRAIEECVANERKRYNIVGRDMFGVLG
jgi:hypothetical protein